MGVLVDIVPNHVGVASPSQNPWWWSLLKEGQQSRYAEAFDVDWDFGGGRIRMPVLGSDDDLDAAGDPATANCATTTTASRWRRAATPKAMTRARSTTGSTTSWSAGAGRTTS